MARNMCLHCHLEIKSPRGKTIAACPYCGKVSDLNKVVITFAQMAIIGVLIGAWPHG